MTSGSSGLSLVVMTVAIVGSFVFILKRFELRRHVSITGTVFGVFFLMHGLFALPLALGSWSLGYATPEISPHFGWVTALSFAGFAIGAGVAANVVGFVVSEAQDRFFLRPMTVDGINYTTYAIAIVATVIVSLFYIFGTSRVGLNVLFTEARSALALKEFRTEAGAYNPYGYAGGLARTIGIPIVMLAAFNMGAVTRRISWKFVAVALAVIGMLVNTASLHKAPVVILVLHLAINRWTRRTRRSTFPVLQATLLMGGLVFALGSAGYYVTYPVSFEEAVLATLRRIFVIPQICFNQFLIVYPNMVDFQHGLGIGVIAKLYGVKNYRSPSGVVAGLLWGNWMGNANAFWSCDLWANFGYSGVVIGSIFVGALLAVLDWWCLSRDKNAVFLALYSYLRVIGVKFPSISLFTNMLSGGIVTGPLLAVLLSLRGRRRSTVARQNPGRKFGSSGELSWSSKGG